MMKRSLSFFLAVLLGLGTAVTTNAAGTARENQRLQEGKITKNEAQHLVLKQYPGAKVKKCELNHGIWMVMIVKAGAKETTQVKIDGNSGKMLP